MRKLKKFTDDYTIDSEDRCMLSAKRRSLAEQLAGCVLMKILRNVKLSFTFSIESVAANSFRKKKKSISFRHY